MSRNEEEYFAREEAEKLHRLHAEKRKELSEEEAKQAKELHHMKCPKCGSDLHEIEWRGVKIDKCYGCQGVFLDDGELEKLAGEEHQGSFVADFMNFFKVK